MTTQVIYIFWTCASLFPEVESLYRWEGKIEESLEVKVILKTVAPHFEAVQAYIKVHCSYQIPEIVQIAIDQGNCAYLSWIAQEAPTSLS